MDVIKLGNIYGFEGGNYAGNVYDIDGIAPALRTCQGGNQQPMIIINDKGFTNKPPMVSEDVSPTLLAESHGNLPKVAIRQATKEPAEFELGGVFNASYPGSNTRRGRVIENGTLSLSPTVTAKGEAGGIVHMNEEYRIRKLTPKECGRLMGVSDEDIDKMAAVNSNTQLYKQFGNSIVVDVMCYMFKNMLEVI